MSLKFNTKKLIAMVHVRALPGTPKYTGSVKTIIDKALEETAIYTKAGVDSIMIENMHDVPYLKRNAGHEISTMMCLIAEKIKSETGLPIGMQILAGANKAALAAANSAGIDFIRAEGFVFGHVADEGIFESDAGEIMRYRKMIGADNIQVFTDIKKKHSSHAITEDVSIVETAKAAEFFISDGVIVTGNATGEEANLVDIVNIKKNVNIPVLIGSGITMENIEKYYNFADGFIVGSYFKREGFWANEIEEERVIGLMNKFRELGKK
jgi:membrane complex biogenesis BtpA family protein